MKLVYFFCCCLLSERRRWYTTVHCLVRMRSCYESALLMYVCLCGQCVCVYQHVSVCPRVYSSVFMCVCRTFFVIVISFSLSLSLSSLNLCVYFCSTTVCGRARPKQQNNNDQETIAKTVCCLNSDRNSREPTMTLSPTSSSPPPSAQLSQEKERGREGERERKREKETSQTTEGRLRSSLKFNKI